MRDRRRRRPSFLNEEDDCHRAASAAADAKRPLFGFPCLSFFVLRRSFLVSQLGCSIRCQCVWLSISSNELTLSRWSSGWSASWGRRRGDRDDRVGRDHKRLSDLVIATWTLHGNAVRSQWPDNPLSVRVPRATSITRCRQLRRALAFDMRERHRQPHIVLQITWWTTSAAATAVASAGGTGNVTSEGRAT